MRPIRQSYLVLLLQQKILNLHPHTNTPFLDLTFPEPS
jgi:hypothetical protein